ncbi:hypothetical protein PJK54_11840 [Cobetia sp. MMG027]|uniref:hypothetical protein n=1 Tax=Cobetia sp. MMG027 TaxID=3021980 RepID=UPI0022FF26CA|nr:hypothetical protein [Cobetia sp. MMG027]MDA5564355.1 hypothetical protein [Cobetia sp. MMG027]
MPWYKDPITILSLIGSIISIISAIVSWRKAIVSKKSADESTKLLGRIRNHRTISTLSEIIAETEILIRSLTDIGPHCDLRRLKGYSTQDITGQLESYRQKIVSKERLLPGQLKDEIRDVIEEMYSTSTKLSDASSPSEIKSLGSKIYLTLTEFKPLLEKQNDHIDNA